ncbi:MAG: DegV family protein [Oscillospiraceae bacterium]
MNIKITSDSTCDLSPELIAAQNISIVPLTVVMGGKNYRDAIDVVPADIFAFVGAGHGFCSTAAVNIAEYEQFFGQFSADYDAVVHICLGAGFSSCYQNACIAAADFPNVHVVDSQNLSTGHGHIVLEAARRAADCTDAGALSDALRELAGRVEASFLLDKLDYMVKGGRCSAVAALGANLLRLKPCIEVADGKMKVVKKYRGSYAKCIADYVDERLCGRGDIVEDTIFITHTPVDDGIVELVKDRVAHSGKQFSEIYQTQAGCTVSCHCGPGTLGVLFIRK